jgi:NitT/TauT family transport system ATP-binding protein
MNALNADELAEPQLPQKPSAIEFSGVTKIYSPGTPREYTSVRDIHLVIADHPNRGEFSSLLGPSGCGKSTLLRLIAGLPPQHPPTHGTVQVLGRTVSGPGADRGMVFQDYTSFDNRTVLDNVIFGLECNGTSRRRREEQGLDWIARVGLDPKRDAGKYPHELSGGMRQRVAIARTLALRPRIILMDEPFGALDPSTRLDMQDLLVQLWQEVQATVLFVTHSIEEAVYLGDRVFVMGANPGRIMKEVPLKTASAPSRQTQREPWFREQVADLADQIEQIESASLRPEGPSQERQRVEEV